MDLGEFVKVTLTEILMGIRKAQDELKASEGKHGVINPTWNDQEDLPAHLQVVNFDVAVTVSDQEAKGGKAGIKVWSIEVGGKREEQTQRETVSRISFAVPILPSTTVVHGVKKPAKD